MPAFFIPELPANVANVHPRGTANPSPILRQPCWIFMSLCNLYPLPLPVPWLSISKPLACTCQLSVSSILLLGWHPWRLVAGKCSPRCKWLRALVTDVFWVRSDGDFRIYTRLYGRHAFPLNRVIHQIYNRRRRRGLLERKESTLINPSGAASALRRFTLR